MGANQDRSVEDGCEIRGSGLLMRIGELTLLCTPAPDQHDRVTALLHALGTVAAAEPETGHQLAAVLAGVVTPDTESWPPLCAFGPFGDGLAAVAYGRADVLVDVDGREVRVAGVTGSMAHDVLAGRVRQVRATAGDGTSALSLVWRGQNDAPAAAPGPSSEAPYPPPGGIALLGLECTGGHFNDPAVAYCTTCGMSMAQADGRPVWGVRPPLGVLVSDDGAVSPLVRDIVLGSAPESDAMVAAGAASAMRLSDRQAAAVQARLILDGWAVTLVSLADGTRIRHAPDGDWSVLVRGASTPLRAGAAIAVGHRELHYQSYRKQPDELPVAGSAGPPSR